ncbi:MAG: hypothetical protein HFG86_01895 [Dorea sp.]|jgi:hypothetical protein|nr:hypothetical protein [Dorea sp.]
MTNVELRKPYKISDLIELVTKDYWAVNQDGINSNHQCPDTGIYDLNIYTNNFEDLIVEDLICYLEEPPEITDEDEEVFPEFVVKEGLTLLYSGENFESVIEVAFDQKHQPSMQEFVDSLNHYREYDSYLDF